MAGQKQPIDYVVEKGKKHLTKAEIEERKSTEPEAITEGIEPPAHLTKKKHKEEFYEIAKMLLDMRAMSATDCDALARYIISKELYLKLTKQILKKEVYSDPKKLQTYMKNQDKAFKQVRQSAMDLGLTITSRARVVVPKKEPPKKKNKFEKFEKIRGCS